MRFLTKSFFARLFFTLVPFAIVVTIVYTKLASTAIYQTEDHIVQQYLHNEQQKFLAQVTQQGKLIPPPATQYLQAYWGNDPELPDDIRQYPVGYHELKSDQPEQDRHLLITDVASVEQQLYVVLVEQQFSATGDYATALNSTLNTIAWLVILGSVIVAAFIAQRLTKPIRALANDVSGEWLAGKQFSGVDRDDEIGSLSRALNELTHRLQSALDKERSFTRHASHEMRTPLAVIRNSLAVLKLPNCSPEKQARNLERIEQACAEAEKMVEVFLWLGRENTALPNNEQSMRSLIETTLIRYETVKAAKGMETVIHGNRDLTVIASTSLISVVIDNLLRNALNYGAGTLDITLDRDSVTFQNPVGSLSSDENNHSLKESNSSHNYGYGLEIVRRICDQAGWTFTVNTDNNIFSARLQFAENKFPGQEVHIQSALC